MVMCVCTSISPGKPVYFERSIVSAPVGIAAESVVTFRMRSPTTITMAFVQSFPLPSQSFPKRTALTVLAPGLSCAQIPPAHEAPRTAARKILIGFMAHPPLHFRSCTSSIVCLLIQLPRECNREVLRITAGGGPCVKASRSAEKKSSLEAWAPQHPRYESRGPIAEEFSHRASPSDSAHALPGIFSSLRLSDRPISRSVSL